MHFNLKNKVVLVTGSSSGIGYEIAKVFLDQGCKVVINGKNNTNLIKASINLNNQNLTFIRADVTKFNQSKSLINKIVKKFGSIDTVVCNVGSGKSQINIPIDKEWKRVFDLNLFASMNIIENSLPFIKRRTGSIICVSSICGLEVVDRAPIAYSSAKAALNMYVKSLSKVIGSDGIRVNAVAPGNILFSGSEWEKKLVKHPVKIKNLLKNNVPLQKFGETKDVANLVLWLSSHYAKFVTGSVYVADGGQTHG